jgi:hypothetical protein
MANHNQTGGKTGKNRNVSNPSASASIPVRMGLSLSAGEIDFLGLADAPTRTLINCHKV